MQLRAEREAAAHQTRVLQLTAERTHAAEHTVRRGRGAALRGLVAMRARLAGVVLVVAG